jgi:hypothetical protein
LLVEQSDDPRVKAVTAVFGRFGEAAETAHYRAVTAQTGYDLVHLSEPRPQRGIARFNYAEILADKPAAQADEDAFLNPHS